MKNIIRFFLVIVVLASCSKPMSRYDREITRAEQLMTADPDSALAILEAIDPAALTVDSVKAKYCYVLASAHDEKGRLTLSDSLIGFSDEYYRGRDLKRGIRSATLLASYTFRIGRRETALRMLDSLAALNYVPDSLLIEPLRARVWLTAYDDNNELCIRSLMATDKRPDRQRQYKFWLYFALLFNGKSDEALEVINDLIISAAAGGDTEMYFLYRYEKVAALMESARYGESLSLVDSLMNETDDHTAIPYFHLWRSLGLLNMGNRSEAASELAEADSLAAAISIEERGYYNSFATLLHSLLDYSIKGKASLMPLARINNPQRDHLFDEQTMREEARRRALEIDNQRLILKAKSERQTALLIIIVLAALLVTALLIWYALAKKRKALDALERNEILQKLVDESDDTKVDSSVLETLRKAMLQQLGIIRMVAETPTQQNRDMLRKISSVGDGPDGSLVNWESVYGMIDSLYSGFYSRLHARYGSALTGKEEQIIALMVAGFSTKEISVITGQTTSTIYVRKSSVRKKLGVPEKEDIVAFLRQQADV